MHTEYEVRILEIDTNVVETRLKELGAEFCWDKIQRRYVYDLIPKVMENGLDLELMVIKQL